MASDKAKVGALLASIPEAQAGNRKLRPEELQSQILAVYRFGAEINQMRDKYCASLEEDQKRKRN